mmetsp:Transcript_4206/g.4610  ORF Transcript_4206/g.4610 Transcript_4206/m.4610 type:complete len:216 (+) Transcript_4206:39-686(+)
MMMEIRRYCYLPFLFFPICTNAFNLLNKHNNINDVSCESTWTRGIHRRINSSPLFMETNDNEEEKTEKTAPKVSNLSLIDLLTPIHDCDVRQMSPTDLAYIGDVVYEIFVRSKYVYPSRRTSDLQNKVVSLVRAEHQAKVLTRLEAEVPLTIDEKMVITRGRNSLVKSNRRKTPAYSAASSLEALLGYVYITSHQQKNDRCTIILNWMYTNLEEV